MKVFILATCRNPDLFEGTTLVFKSLRTGFPTADIVVFDNANSEFHRSEIRECVKKVKGEFVHLPNRTVHHVWIEALYEAALKDESSEPFFICDTDVIFWDNFEQWDFNGEGLAGRFIPRFMCPFNRCETRARFHTCLLRFDPAILRKQVGEYNAHFPESPFDIPLPNLIHPRYFPARDGSHLANCFDDTAGMLYQAVGGIGFTEAQLNCFDHIHCGTYADVVSPRFKEVFGRELHEAHKAIYANPELARGCWKAQDTYYGFARC